MIEIIKADKQHMFEIGNLWMEFMRFSQDIDNIYAPEDGSIPTFIKEYLSPAIEAEDSLVLVAMDEEKAIGYSYSLIVEPPNPVKRIEKRGRYGVIHDFFITARYRREGIGDNMYAKISEWFLSKGIHRIELDVITKNQMASSFWEKHGFMDIHRRLYRNL